MFIDIFAIYFNCTKKTLFNFYIIFVACEKQLLSQKIKFKKNIINLGSNRSKSISLSFSLFIFLYSPHGSNFGLLFFTTTLEIQHFFLKKQHSYLLYFIICHKIDYISKNQESFLSLNIIILSGLL